jgi:hypothetical protein
MADETRTENGQFAKLDQADMATYKKIRAAQLAGDDEEDIDTEPAKAPTGEESMAEYKKLRNEQEQDRKHGGGVQKKINQLTKQRSIAREENEKLRQQIARYESGEIKPGEVPAQPEVSEEDRRAWQARGARHDAAVEKWRKEDPADFEEVNKAAGKIRINER